MKTTLTKPTRTTQAAKVVALGDVQAAEICKILGWTEQQYYDHQYEQYEEYLKRSLYGLQEELYNASRYSGLMRGFWNNEWVRRNYSFLLVAEDLLYEGVAVDTDGQLIEITHDEAVLAHLYDEYMYMHNAVLLSSNPYVRERFMHILKLMGV